jgi:hypothetical protein
LANPALDQKVPNRMLMKKVLTIPTFTGSSAAGG